MAVDNYKQIIDIKDDLIRLENLSIKGNSLKIKYLDKYRLVVEGLIKDIAIGE
ncbi:MAG: hypothetical protein E7176_05185 [Erysipelotrichaceae bacterium]|nr:hypothetical protein [Erysipelotrichaceae bacterium]